MARKLNSDEQQMFVDALHKEESPANDSATDQFLRAFSEKRDTALRLSPELIALLGNDPFGPISS
jgi:hypothetical protein